MSRGSVHGENAAKCSTKTLTRVPEDEGSVLNPFLWPPITENHYRNYDIVTKSLTRVDRPAQTELSVSKHNILNSVLSNHTYFSETAKTPRERTDWPVDKGENSDEDYPRQDYSAYESACTDPSNPLYGVSMKSRKSMFDKSGGSRGSDLERKKLEAELKAAQEIARIQQTVIEKRLALELASIHNGKEGKDGRDSREHTPHQIHHTPKAQSDFVMLEEVTRRNPVIENNYASEMEPQRIRPVTPKPVKPISSMSSRLVNSERLRNGFGNELLYRRSNSPENYGSGNSSPRGMSELQPPEMKYYNPPNARIQRPSVQMPVQMAPHRDEIYERPGWPGHQPRNRFSWKAFVAKVKRGFRHKSREDWD